MPETVETAETQSAPMPTRLERLAVLWGVSVEEAEKRDNEQKAALEAARKARHERREAQAKQEADEKKALSATQKQKTASPAKSAAAGSQVKPDGTGT